MRMSIRTKCALLVLAFELTLCATLMLTVRYIGAYFDDATKAFHTSNTGLADVSRLRSLVRSQLLLLVRFGNTPTEQEDLARLNNQIDESADLLREHVIACCGELRWARLSRLVHEQIESAKRLGLSLSPDSYDPKAPIALDAELGELESRLLHEASARVDQAFEGQRRAILILWANAAVGIALGLVGLLLMRRWVLIPIRKLEQTADELGRGNLDHRAAINSGDEFGRLAAAVNKMSADLARIERQMIQRERLAAMGELIAYVAHNIRNPLAGIQAAAEAGLRQASADSALRDRLDAIVAAVEKFQTWLRQLEHTCSPMELQAEPVELSRLLDNVAAVFRPMAERRGVKIETRIQNASQQVRVDPRHFEHAVAAVLGNAIEAASDGGRVQIGMSENGDPSVWTLTVSDNGPGIDPATIDRIFEPAYSTKRSGHGLGLMMAKKIVEMHGGQIAAESTPGEGTTLRFIMPRQPVSRRPNG